MENYIGFLYWKFWRVLERSNIAGMLKKYKKIKYQKINSEFSKF